MPTAVYLVAENKAGQIVGYASFWWDANDDKPSTFGICIQKAYRGIALGQALIARLSEVAEDIGPTVMNLTVQKANPRAFALYSKMGFQVLREQMRGQVEEFPAGARVLYGTRSAIIYLRSAQLAFIRSDTLTILRISASERKQGITGKAVRAVLEATGQPHEYVSLSGLKIYGCRNCTVCAGDNQYECDCVRRAKLLRHDLSNKNGQKCRSIEWGKSSVVCCTAERVKIMHTKIRRLIQP